MQWEKEYEKLGFRHDESGSAMHQHSGCTFRAWCADGVVTVSATICEGLTVSRSSLVSDPVRAWDLMREHIRSLTHTMQRINEAVTPKATRGEVRVEVKGITSTQPAAIKRGNYGMMGDHD